MKVRRNGVEKVDHVITTNTNCLFKQSTRSMANNCVALMKKCAMQLNFLKIERGCTEMDESFKNRDGTGTFPSSLGRRRKLLRKPDCGLKSYQMIV